MPSRPAATIPASTRYGLAEADGVRHSKYVPDCPPAFARSAACSTLSQFRLTRIHGRTFVNYVSNSTEQANTRYRSVLEPLFTTQAINWKCESPKHKYHKNRKFRCRKSHASASEYPDGRSWSPGPVSHTVVARHCRGTESLQRWQVMEQSANPVLGGLRELVFLRTEQIVAPTIH